jgi:Uma2 family endonuclease
MAGASPRHNHVALGLATELRSRLAPRGCFVAGSDQRVRLGASGPWVYPDVVASCSPRFEPPRPLSLVTLELVIEVLSRTTGSHDLSAKLAHYRACDAIQEIAFVRTTERLVEHHRRVEPSRWLVSLVREATVSLAGEVIAIESIYAGAEAPPDDDGA